MPIEAHCVHDCRADSRSVACRHPWPDVHVALRPTQEKTQSVHSIAFDFSKLHHGPVHMDEEAWTNILRFITKLVLRDTRPEILFLFPSTESAASCLRQVSILNVASFIASGRVKCVIEPNCRTLKLVKSDENGDWRVLGASTSTSCVISDDP